MPIHDWTRVKAGIFHDFHHGWISQLSRALNRGLLPVDNYAMAEQVAGRKGPDALTPDMPKSRREPRPTANGGGLALATGTRAPKARFYARLEEEGYAGKAKAVVVRHASEHNMVARIELVSPGNKASRSALSSFVRKAQEAMEAGIHLLIVDLFPPGPRDPEGIHRVIWEDRHGSFALPPETPLTCVTYVGAPIPEVFLEPVAVGDSLPEMPLFLEPDIYVPVPLEATYQAAWEAVPEYWRDVLAGGASS